MTRIQLITYINASAEICFDLSRDVLIHQRSAIKTKERAVAGRKKGLLELNETVTWEAVHFGIRQYLTVKITQMNRPHFFEDQMIKGAFKKMCHRHYFDNTGTGTKMTDVFEYETPYGLPGRIFDKMILKTYMTEFLIIRNQLIKSMAEKNLNHDYTGI